MLENSRGERCEEEREIVNILIELYDNLFSSSIPVQIEEALEATPLVITAEMNNELLAPFQRSEVDFALKQMNPLKALGPNRMPPLFFQ